MGVATVAQKTRALPSLASSHERRQARGPTIKMQYGMFGSKAEGNLCG